MLDYIFILALLSMVFLSFEAKSKKVAMKHRAIQNRQIREMLIQKMQANESQ